jgi:hypothetical protein
VAVPTARASGIEQLEIVVDSHERYGYRFSGQQVTTRRAALPSGDYGVMVDGDLYAAVERKALGDLVSSLTTGKLRYQLADLAALPHAAVVVEDRYSQVFKHRHVRPAVIADGLAECQVRWPGVPILFCETRPLAEEWTYRFLAAAVAGATLEAGGLLVVHDLAEAPPLAAPEPTTAQVRAWALDAGYDVSDRGRIGVEIRDAYRRAHPD